MKTAPIATTETEAIKTLVQAGFLPKETVEISDRETLQTIFTDLKPPLIARFRNLLICVCDRPAQHCSVRFFEWFE